MTNNEPIEAKKFDDKELRALNLFFGIIIVVLSIYVIMSLIIFTVNTQLILISASLLIIGAAFTSIGIADKDQTQDARKIEILFGFIVTVVGLIQFFISLIISNLIIQILLLIINVICGIVGLAAILAVSSERWSIIRSRRIMILMGGAPMFGSSLINIVILIFGFLLSADFNHIIIILLFITLLLHGLARIVIYKTGIYE